MGSIYRKENSGLRTKHYFSIGLSDKTSAIKEPFTSKFFNLSGLIL